MIKDSYNTAIVGKLQNYLPFFKQNFLIFTVTNQLSGTSGGRNSATNALMIYIKRGIFYSCIRCSFIRLSYPKYYHQG